MATGIVEEKFHRSGRGGTSCFSDGRFRCKACAVSASENESNPNPLSGFLLGPTWARTSGSPPAKPARDDSVPDNRDAPERRFERPRDSRGGRDDRRERDDRGGRDDRRGGGGGGGDRRGKFQDRREPRQEVREIEPAPGVRVTLMPDPQAVHLIGKEVHQVARVYSLFDVAQILLAERGRCRARFEVGASRPPLLHCKLDGALFLTKEEALRHLWKPELIKQVLEVETVEVEPPTGRYNAVARCGFSGVWLGPPNHHSYQTNLRRLHRECFAHIPFEFFSGKVRTERSEEAVAAWLETMKTKQRWRFIGDGDDAWMEDKAAAENAMATRCFEQAFVEVKSVEISAGVASDSLSPSLWVSLRHAGFHVKHNPAVLIPAICAALESEHLPVFKRGGKLYTGPSRPHPLPEGVPLAERPSRIIEWVRSNSPANLAGLWQAVHPTGGTEPCLEYVNDLFWLLNQGHLLLFSDDSLALAGSREPEPPKPPKGPKPQKAPKQGKRDRRTGEQAAAAVASGETTTTGADATGETEGTPGESADAETEPSSDEPSVSDETADTAGDLTEGGPAEEIPAPPADDVPEPAETATPEPPAVEVADEAPPAPVAEETPEPVAEAPAEPVAEAPPEAVAEPVVPAAEPETEPEQETASGASDEDGETPPNPS